MSRCFWIAISTSVGLHFAATATALGGLTVSLDDVQVQQADLPIDVLVPVRLTNSTTGEAEISSLSLKIDIGITPGAISPNSPNSPNALPTGFSFAAQPVQGGATHTKNWPLGVDTTSSFLDADIDILGPSISLGSPPPDNIVVPASGVHLFSLALTLSTAASGKTLLGVGSDRTNPFTPSELTVDSFTPGSITIIPTAVPEPSPFVLFGLLGVVVAYARRSRKSPTLETRD